MCICEPNLTFAFQGCYTKLRSYVVDQAYIILAVAAGALVIQVNITNNSIKLTLSLNSFP